MWHRRGSSGEGGGEVGGDVDAASRCYDKSGGAADRRGVFFCVVMVKYVCRGFTELVRRTQTNTSSGTHNVISAG